MVSNPDRRTSQWDRWLVSTLWAIIAGAFGAGGTWMAMSKDIEIVQEDVRGLMQVDSQQGATINSLRADVIQQQQQFTERIHALDTGQAIILEQLKEIRAAQDRMDKNLEKLANGRAKELGIAK